jgi:hypothetical protein
MDKLIDFTRLSKKFLPLSKMGEMGEIRETGIILTSASPNLSQIPQLSHFQPLRRKIIFG